MPMPRRPLLPNELPDHLGKYCNFDSQETWRDSRDGKCLHISITCPKCGQKRWVGVSYIRAQLRRGIWSGRCKACNPGNELNHARGPANHKWKGGRYITSDGYVTRNTATFNDLELKILRPMLRKGKRIISEHRAVMALFLGRPLQRWEVVDHIDDNKSNNDISNLKLYPADTAHLAKTLIVNIKVKELERALFKMGAAWLRERERGFA